MAEADDLHSAAHNMQAKQVTASAEAPVSEACLRNQQPIADMLERELPPHSVVLEIGSGTGQHAAFISRRLPGIKWQPSELADRIAGINAWRERAQNSNFLPPLVLDVAQDLWPVKQVDAVFSANVVHFIGWPKVRAMMAGIGRVLKHTGLAFFYGPFNYGGQFTSDGNRLLDQWLRERDPDSGIKDFEQIVLAARKEKLRLLKDISMPANNRLLVLQKYV
jgi:SAM-dependent methyltransferase